MANAHRAADAEQDVSLSSRLLLEVERPTVGESAVESSLASDDGEDLQVEVNDGHQRYQTYVRNAKC